MLTVKPVGTIEVIHSLAQSNAKYDEYLTNIYNIVTIASELAILGN